MAKHGGVHEWDLTISDVHMVIKVRERRFLKRLDIKMTDSFVEVVQHHNDGI